MVAITTSMTGTSRLGAVATLVWRICGNRVTLAMNSTDPPMHDAVEQHPGQVGAAAPGQREDHDAGDSDQHAGQQGDVAGGQPVGGVAEDQQQHVGQRREQGGDAETEPGPPAPPGRPAVPVGEAHRRGQPAPISPIPLTRRLTSCGRGLSSRTANRATTSAATAAESAESPSSRTLGTGQPLHTGDATTAGG